MKPLFVIILPILLCFRAFAGAAVDSPNYFLRHFDSDNGLPQNSVYAIMQDKNGYIWMTTGNGLVRFDGSGFKAADVKHLTLKSNRFYVIFPDRSGNAAALNEQDEAIHMDAGVTRRYTFLPEEARNYVKWYQPEMKNHFGVSYNTALPGSWTRSGIRQRELKLYVDHQQFYLYRNDTVRYAKDGATLYALPFRPDGGSNFFTLDKRFFYLSNDGQVTVFGPQRKHSALTGDILQDPAYHRPDRVVVPFWNTYDTSHLLLYFNRTFYLTTRDSRDGLVTRKLLGNFDAIGNEINCALYREKEDRLFLGSRTNGLYVLARQQFISKQASEGSGSFYSQIPYGKDAILVPGGYILKPGGEASSLLALKALKVIDIYSISSNGEDSSWMKSGPFLYHLKLNPFQVLAVDTLPVLITMLYRDDDHRLWIGMKGGRGVAVLDGNSKDAKPVMVHAFKEDITYFAKVSSREMCIGTDRGLFLLDPLSSNIDTVKGLEDQYIRSIIVTGTDEIWVTTYDHGIYLYHKKRLTHFPYDEEEYIDNAHCMMPDRKGFFWISTNRGLFQVSRQDLLAYAENNGYRPYYHYYDNADGFSTNEFNGGCQPCAVNMGNGYISFPSLKGMVFFNPDVIKPLLPEKPLMIDQVLLDNSPLPVGNVLQLPRTFTSLQVMYSCPYQGNSKNLVISYALVKNGGDTAWLPLRMEGKVSLSTLGAGSYSLVLRKLNGFGYGNFSDKILQLEVPFAWYETVWCYIVCALLLLLLVWVFVWLRVRYLQKRAQHLERKVALKTGELQKRTELQERIVQSISHNVLTPLQYQQFLAEKIFLEVEKNATVPSKVARVMNEHSSYLFHMVSNLLKYLKSQMEIGSVNNFYAPSVVAENIQKIFQSIASEKGTKIRNDIPVSLILCGDEQLLSVMLYNLVDNAVKVTRNGLVVMEAITAEDHILLRVSDTGPGVPAAVKDWFNRPGNAVDTKKEWGIGLLIVKELADKQGLNVALESIEGKGSTFTVGSFYPHPAH